MTRKIFFGLMCMTFAVFLVTATSVEAGKPGCGDGICGPKENVDNCPADCGSSSFCGDSICDLDEDQCSCPGDCGTPPSTEVSCDNGIDDDCDGIIDCLDPDCVDDPSCPCNNDGVCNEGEDCQNCPGDCSGGQGGTCDACFKGKCDGICNPKKEGPECADCASFCCGLDTCDPELCGSDCGSPITVCGNGIIETGEECDDGGESATCDIDCTLAVCGDGLPNQAAGEECDDGNTIIGDGCDANCLNEASAVVPLNQFNIGDSIGEGEAADGTIGEAHHDLVWSTGYNLTDIVYSFNERFEDVDETSYYENNITRDPIFNHAVSGNVMSNFYGQAYDVVVDASQSPDREAGMVTILLGNNDVCADSIDAMTDPIDFEAQYRAGLDELASSDATKNAVIHVSGIPDIYWLWVAKKDSSGCRLVWWFGGVCQALLQNPSDDCESTTSRDDPDTIYSGDGPNCLRRKEFHRRIKEVYNPILRDVLNEYKNNGKLPNAEYVDIFNVVFESNHVNNGDCFHPSTTGHAFLANKEWCRSSWGSNDPVCSP
jgi:lysophospholipase L1-like esterase